MPISSDKNKDNSPVIHCGKGGLCRLSCTSECNNKKLSRKEAIKYGVFNSDHTRREQSIGLNFELNNHKGQLVISDGEKCISLDDYWSDKNTVHEKMFLGTKEINDEFPDMPPRIDWFVSGNEPITWVGSFEIAQQFIKKQPSEFTLCKSTPIKSKAV